MVKVPAKIKYQMGLLVEQQRKRVEKHQLKLDALIKSFNEMEVDDAKTEGN